MKTWTVAAALLFVSASGLAQTTPTALPHKSCDDLKAEISKKLDAKGAVGYTLDAVEKSREGGGKVVGSCDGGSKSLVYTRAGATTAEAKPADTQPADTKKPE